MQKLFTNLLGCPFDKVGTSAIIPHTPISMIKYWAVLKINFLSAFAKKGDFIGQVLINFIQISSFILIWKYSFNNRTFQGYTLQDTIVYYVFVLFITYATLTTTVDYLSKSIKNGSLSEWLIKPRAILFTEIARSLGEMFFRMIQLLPIYLIIAIITTIIAQTAIFSFQSVLFALIFALIGLFINILLEYCLSLLAFWMDEVWSLKHFKDIFADLFGGKRIPLAFFPPVALSVLNILPLRFIFSVPLEYLLQKKSTANLSFDLTLAFIWLITLLIIANILFKKGIRKYAAFGN